jgi:hypothetical protein
MGQTPLQPPQNDDYELSTLFLIGGVLHAGYRKGADSFVAQICHVLNPSDAHAVITTKKIQPDVLSTKISRPFQHSHLIDVNFYVVEKIKEVEGQAMGKQRGLDVWLPIQKTNDDVLYVRYPDNGPYRLVILEHTRPYTSLRKAAIGISVGAGAVAAAGLTILAAPLAVAGLGFGAGGIAAGSAAATMMSMGVVGVATLQSIGAAGMGLASIIVMGGVGAGTVGITAGAVAVATGATYTVGGMKPLFLIHDRVERPMPLVEEFLALPDNPPPKQ